MKKSWFFLLALCWLTLINSASAEDLTSSPDTKIVWQNLSPSVFTSAKEQNKFVFLYAKSESCHWCKKMKDETFNDSKVIAMITKNYIPVSEDIELNPKIVSQYKITSLPTIIILDEN